MAARCASPPSGRTSPTTSTPSWTTRRHPQNPTHAHPEGRAGAIAIAVATAVAQRFDKGTDPKRLLDEVALRVPPGATREGIEYAAKLGLDVDVRTAVAALGNGSLVLSSDTVPLSLWCAARHLFEFEEAMWTTVSALGDRDTTCAIVGGIVASTGAVIPAHFFESREPLPLSALAVEQ